MANLPAKQSIFSKVRNSILNSGLKNRFTRNIISNFAPDIFGYSLVNYVLNNDNQDLDGTMELLSSMNEKAIKSNFSTMFRKISNKRRDNEMDKVINKMFDTIKDELNETLCIEILKSHNQHYLNFTDETYKRIVDSINYQTKSQEEMDNLLQTIENDYTLSYNVGNNLFEKLTLDQKKQHFSKFISIVSQSYSFDHNVAKLFEQFPEEERLEQYNKILEVCKNENILSNISELSACFKMLQEKEKLIVVEDTFDLIKNSNDKSKGIAASRVLSNIPVEEQNKYYKEVFEYSNKNLNEINEYVCSLDKSLHNNIAYAVINTIRESTKINYSNQYDITHIMNNLNSSDKNNVFINILNDSNLDNPNIEFVLDLLELEGQTESLENFSKENNVQIITQDKLKILQEKKFNINALAKVSTTTECSRLINEYLKNPDDKTYIYTIEEISKLSSDLYFNPAFNYNSSVTYNSIIENKLNAYLNLFSELDYKDRGRLFQNTLNGMLNLSEDEKIHRSQIRMMYELLDTENQISQFSDLINSIFMKANDSLDCKNLIADLIEKMDSKSLNLIYSQYINILNKGIESEDYQKGIPALLSEKFTDGLIDKISKEKNISFLTEKDLQNILMDNNPILKLGKEPICKIFVATRLNKIKDSYNSLDENRKDEQLDEFLLQLSQKFDFISNYHINKLHIDAIFEIFNSIDNDKKGEHFNGLYAALENLSNLKNEGYLQVFESLDKEEKVQRFPDFFKHMNLDSSSFLNLYSMIENDDKPQIFEDYIIATGELKWGAEILDKYSVKALNEIFKGKTILDEKTIAELMELKDNIAIKTLFFDKNIDREKLIDLSSYDQLQNEAINIDSVIQNLYVTNKEKSRQEFNQILSNTYNLFTYNNVPEFLKNFRLFQLGSYYNIENPNIKSFQSKTKEERDSLILEDLFKISLDSNNESLRDFSNIIIEGKRLTTVLQSNPEEKIKTLSTEELAVLEQYRDTLFDLHNIAKEIRNTDKPIVGKSDDVIKDLRTLISIYSDNKERNPNSINLVFNPNKIMDELFKGFITTTIRPKAMLEYMNKVKESTDAKNLEIEKKLKDGTMHLQEGDFIKGIQSFDEYIPSMLRDGIKGGEFNQEHSHSDATPLDADFGYISKGNLTKDGATDYEIISTTISSGYGHDYIVLKNYADRLANRTKESFDQGTFTGSPDYYEMDAGEEDIKKSRYVRTGIPITDVDYIVSLDFNPKNRYEMAMAGIYIPVIDTKGNIVFSSDDYKKIREEMRGLSYYNAQNLEVNKNVKNMDVLYEVYKGISTKSNEEIDKELELVKGLVDGKPDIVTIQKKKATTQFIKDYFETQGIKVTDDLSQNLSTSSIELIDTGSTGRGTNVPGDGDFDFMLRHNLSSETLKGLSDKIKEATPTENFTTVGDGFRAKNVTLPDGEKVDIDITTAKKSLSLSYSSDMCVRDRLNNIKENDPEKYNYVQANIIMAKKILKAKGIYKKLNSDGATEHGGFGGIGVENWILQNGGSFEQAIETFLEVANETNSYDEFKNKYPIFDFGFNHREGKIRHDRYSSFFANDESKPNIGFNYAKEALTEIQKALNLEKEKQEIQNIESPLIQSISPEGFAEAGSKNSSLRNKFSFSKMRGMVSKFMSTQEIEQNKTNLEERNND